jgi:unsaturated chondroitin disaccharide hydrolase
MTQTLERHSRIAPLSDAELERAWTDGLEKVRLLMRDFTFTMPENNTVGNVYHPRQPRKDHVLGGNSGWTTSFWTGSLWLSFERTNDPAFRSAAEVHLMSFKDRLERRVDVAHHDIGFLYTLGAVSAYKVSQNPLARAVALEAADVLLERWLPGYNVLQAWGDLQDEAFRGRFIVDCLLNLPLLYWASAETGEVKYAEVALEHARQTKRHLIRDNGRTFHTCFVDERGQFVRAMTHQGAGHESCWSRGQAWAILGFALSHRLGSRSDGFLETSRRAADYFLSVLPEDLIAYWDLDFNNVPNEERDSSAAAIAACGLLELADALGEAGVTYRDVAERIVASLARGYTSRDLPEANCLLLHGTYRKPHGIGIDEGCLWGDYYYLEALTRLQHERRGERWHSYW